MTGPSRACYNGGVGRGGLPTGGERMETDEALDHHAIRRLVELSADRDDLLVSVVEPEDGTILWCSERALRKLVGREPDEVIGRPTCDVMRPSEREYWSRARVHAASGETFQAVREVERPNGRRVRLSSTAWRVDGDRGPVVAVTTIDPTERRR